MTTPVSLTPPSQHTSVTCAKCNKPTTVPFVPTPGRPVFCRDCFVRPTTTPRGPMGQRTYEPRPSGAQVEGARKRMMAQGRKTHFIFDAKAILADIPGGMDAKDNRAFLEGLFARGARTSTDAAQVFLEEKVKDGAVTHDQAVQLGRLIDRYSFVR